MKNLAYYAYSTGARGLFVLFFGALVGCSALQAPTRPVVYDFGPGPMQAGSTQARAPMAALVLADVESNSAFDGTAVWYRLLYSDAQQLRPYAMARWSMAPAALMRQRLREQLGVGRAVLGAADGITPPANALVLRVELEEFSQLFESATRSTVLLRVRATLGEARPGMSDTLVGQRSFVVQKPAITADAAGGVHALTDATDVLIAELNGWIAQARPATPEISPR